MSVMRTEYFSDIQRIVHRDIFLQ